MVRKSLIYANNILILSTVHLVVSERAGYELLKLKLKLQGLTKTTLHCSMWVAGHSCVLPIVNNICSINVETHPHWADYVTRKCINLASFRIAKCFSCKAI